jgi:hypothetical protein
MTDGNRELVEQIFRDARFIGSLGIELKSFGRGWCETAVGAAASTVSEDKDVITVENKTSFLRPATASVLSCRAEVLRSGKNLVFVEATVTAESKDGRVLIAKTSSTLAVIPQRLRREG